MVMAQTATVTSKSMVNIPAKIRRKYGIRQGTKLVFLENEQTITLIPVPSLSELFGADREHKDEILQAIREMEEEHRRDAER